MVEPINKLVRIAENDVPLPIAGGDNKIEPSLNLLTVGFDKGNKAFAENLNYIFDNLAQWINYSQERIDDLTAQVEKERVSVGEIIEITGDSTNPSVLKGYGTWESFGEGQVLVGVGEHTDDRSESKTWVDGDSEGEYQHVQTETELAEHTHTNTVSEDTHNHVYSRTSSFSGDYGGSGSDLPYTRTVQTDGTSAPGITGGNEGVGVSIQITNTATTMANVVHDHTVTIADTGDSSPMNNIQPSLAVYRWKRTA